MANSLMERSVQAVYIYSNRYNGKGNDAQIPVKLLTSDRSLESFQEDKVINVEVDTEHQHKNAYDNFKVFVVIVTNAGAVVRETARAGSAEHIDETVKQRHSTRKKEDKQQCRHRKIDAVENRCGVAHLRNEFGRGRTRCFCSENIHAALAAERNNDHAEYKNSHAANPVGEAAPEQHGVVE